MRKLYALIAVTVFNLTSVAIAQTDQLTQQQREANEAATAGCAVCGGSIVFIIVVAVVLIALNIALLIWVARDAKNRSMDSSVLWMFLVMFTGPIGLIIYTFSRPQGQLTQCASCNGKRLSASAKCPHCQNT
jgi:ABC-type phosphate transport system permease subunit